MYLAHDKNETAVLGWSFASPDDAIECAIESGDYGNLTVTEIIVPDNATEDDFISCAEISEYEKVAKSL